MILGLCLLGFWPLTGSLVMGQDPPAFTEPDQETGDAAVAAPTPELIRRRAVVVGSLLLALVVVCGLTLVLFVLMLGRRTRALARKSLPGASPRDDLWFLRKPKPPPGDRRVVDPERPSSGAS